MSSSETNKPNTATGADDKCASCPEQAACEKAREMEKWREDFPVEWVADNYITRREFTKFLVLTSGATVLGNGYFVLREAVAARQAAQAEISPVRLAAVDEMNIGEVK